MWWHFSSHCLESWSSNYSWSKKNNPIKTVFIAEKMLRTGLCMYKYSFSFKRKWTYSWKKRKVRKTSCPVHDSSVNIMCGWPGWVLLLLTLIPPLPPKQHITPTLIPPAAQGKFEPEWQTKNHFVDEIAPLNRYLFIYSFTYLLIPCDPRGKQIKIPASI